MKFPKALSVFLFLLVSVTTSTAVTAGKLEIHDAWAREAPPNAAVMAAYLTLHNHSAKTYTLISASSPDFTRVEMHRTEQHDGMAKMLPVSRVMVSTNSSVSFQPGGMHLMLMTPKKPLKVGDSISLTLFFSDESSQKISVPVKKGSGSNGHAMHHGSHEPTHDKHQKNHDKMQHDAHSH